MQIFLLLFLFLQLPTAEDYQKMMTPQAQIARAESAIALRQKSVEDAVRMDKEWQRQIVARTQEKNALIEKTKAVNHLDATWTWDDATSKFVQKR